MPWGYLVAFKDFESRTNWYQNSAEINIQLQQRIHRTNSGSPALLHFDAPTMRSYQIPPKLFENIYCRQGISVVSAECDDYVGFDPELVNVPVSNLEVRKSSFGENAGRGIFARNDVRNGSYIGLEESVKNLHFLPSTWSVIYGLYEWADNNEELLAVEDELSSVVTYIEGYGFGSTLLVSHISPW